MRGAYDFETWGWINPICAALVWGDKGNRENWYTVDNTHKDPKSVARNTLKQMMLLSNAETPVKQWWAHNGGKYDCLFMLEAAIELGWKVRAQIAGGRGIQIWITSPEFKNSVSLLDSFCLAQASLKDCVKDFALPSAKLFTEEDYSKDTRTWNKDKLRKGCIIDCELVLELVETIESYCESWGGKLGPTFSSSALSVVKASLEERGIDFPSHQHIQHINEWCRKGFYGGRVEVFVHKPDYDLTEYDVTSSYPWAACQSLPWEFLGEASNQDMQDMLEHSYGRDDFEGMIRARVNVPEMDIPPLPYRVERGGIFFPTGEWEAVFPAVELRHAIKHGVTVAPLKGMVYSKASHFKPIIDALFELKRNSIGAQRTFAKLSLNGGCFGKFAQAPEREELLVTQSEEESINIIASAPIGSVGRISNDLRFLAIKKFRWPRHTHYALASYITANARIKLHDGLLATEGAAYCDSDSIHCGVETKLDNVGELLGQWKVEIKRYRGEFFAPKLYRLKESDGKTHLAAKGFPVNEDDFESIIACEDVMTERMQLLKTQARSDGSVRRKRHLKQWSGRSAKRAALPGCPEGRTRPWRVSELERAAYLCHYSPLAAITHRR